MRSVLAGRTFSRACLVLIAALAIGGLVQVDVDTRLTSFVPADSVEAQERRAETFGGDPIIVLLESGSDDSPLLSEEGLPLLVRLEGELARIDGVTSVYGPGSLLNQTAGAIQNLLALISGRRDAVEIESRQQALQEGATPAGARRASRRALTTFDERYGALLVEGLPVGLPTLRNRQFVANVVFDERGEPKPSWRTLVPAPGSVAILVRPRDGLDQVAAAALSRRVRAEVDSSGLSSERQLVTGLPVLTAAVADEAKSELPVLAALGALVVGLVLMLVPWTRPRRRLLPLVASGLGGAATVGALGWADRPVTLGVVAFLPIMFGIGADFPVYLVRRLAALRHILVAAGAAACGFLSLVLSPLPFVRELGVALAVGVVLTVLSGILLTRAWPDHPGPDPHTRAELADAGARTPRGRRLVALVAVAGVSGLGWALLPGTSVESDVSRLAAGVPALDDVRAAADALGVTGEVSVVIEGKDVRSPEALAWARDAQEAIAVHQADDLRPVLTLTGLVSFLGQSPDPQQIASAFGILPDYLTSAVLSADGRQGLMIYGTVSEDVRVQAEALDELRAVLPEPPRGYSVEVVGIPVAAADALKDVNDHLLLRNVLTVLAAVGLVAVMTRRSSGVVRVLITVVLATGLVVLAALVLGGALNPLTVAVAALVTATGAEFAMMLSSSNSWRAALPGVSTAAAAAVGGYSVLMLSGLDVIVDLGQVLSLSVLMSFATAVLVAWAFDGPTTANGN